MKAMALTSLSVVVMVLLQMHLISAGRSPTQQCGPGMMNPCPDPSLCCNAKSKCGATLSDCGDGCQSGPCLYMKAFLPDSNVGSSSKEQVVTAGRNPTQQCGPGMMNPCPDRSCCNAKSKCGLTQEDCGAGCQSGPCLYMKAFLPESDVDSSSKEQVVTAGRSPTQQCGPGMMNPCPDPSLCCNAKSKCGATLSDCGDGCQSGPCLYMKAFLPDSNVGSSSKEQVVTAGRNPTQQCGPGMMNPCPDRSCCNAKSKCGATPEDCGAGCQSGPCLYMKAFLPDSGEGVAAAAAKQSKETDAKSQQQSVTGGWN